MDPRKLLHQLSDNIQSKVLTAIPRRGTMPSNKFKNLLDKQAQEAIIESLNKQKADVTLISEEGDRVFGNGDYIITADPVDGTSNLSRGFPPSVLSLSLATEPMQSKVIAGIITNFYTGESYYAEKDQGATLDDAPISVSSYIPYKHGLIGMELSKDPKLEKTRRLIAESRHIRQEGCSAASLCHVAEGVLDAHIDLRGIVRATDISAGLFIIEQAGGVYSVNDEPFGELDLTRETRCRIIAANTKRLHDEIAGLIQ